MTPTARLIENQDENVGQQCDCEECREGGDMKSKGRWKGWCGFENGRPAAIKRPVAGTMDQYGSGLFRFRETALKGYRDVRRVVVTWRPPRTKQAGATRARGGKGEG